MFRNPLDYYLCIYIHCIDINECFKHTHNCATNENCINTIGSFLCECSSGYEWDENDACVGQFITLLLFI